MSQTDRLPEAPRAIVAGDRWQVGVYRTPFRSVDMSTAGWRRFRLKEWHYLSFTTEDWFVAFGLVQLGYVANLFAYAVDHARRGRAVEHGVLSPLGAALTMAESSVSGRTAWQSRGAEVTIDAADGWNVTVDIPLGKERLQGRARIDAEESLAMLHPLGPRRIAYTHKAAGWPASGELTLGTRTIPLEGGLAASDWTRSQASRITEWKWASLSHRLPDGNTLGLNLSAQVYEDAGGHSVENALFLNGRVTHLRGVRFALPDDPRRGRWQIESLGSGEVELEFEPLGAREDHTNFGLVRTEFVQPYGRFTGRVCGHDVTDAFGVVEVHLSVW